MVSVILVRSSSTANLPVLFTLKGVPLQVTVHVCLSHSRPTCVVAVYTTLAMAALLITGTLTISDNDLYTFQLMMS